jgi:hypothetical protein
MSYKRATDVESVRFCTEKDLITSNAKCALRRLYPTQCIIYHTLVYNSPTIIQGGDDSIQ